LAGNLLQTGPSGLAARFNYRLPSLRPQAPDNDSRFERGGNVPIWQ
jgi:hypothetical protein